MSADKKAPRAPAKPGHGAEPYLPWDPIPMPHAVEKNSDSMWDLWQKTHKDHEAGYAQTAPAPVTGRAPIDTAFASTEPAGLGTATPRKAAAAPRGPISKDPTVHEAMVEARRNNRVCPSPARWQQVYDMLPNKQGNRPTPPLVGPSWLATPSLSKRMCLREHLDWAEANGALGAVLSFLKQLPEEEWHHMGE